MTDQELKEKVYEPYNEAWKIIKQFQHGNYEADGLWDKFVDDTERLNHAYPRNKYIDQLCQLLLTVGEYIAEENSKTN